MNAKCTVLRLFVENKWKSLIRKYCRLQIHRLKRNLKSLNQIRLISLLNANGTKNGQNYIGRQLYGYTSQEVCNSLLRRLHRTCDIKIHFGMGKHKENTLMQEISKVPPDLVRSLKCLRRMRKEEVLNLKRRKRISHK